MILITGASGFVGGKLMAMGKDVVAAPSLRGWTQESLCRLVEDSGATAIVHTAAISDIGVCERDPDASYQANVLLPVALAKAAKGRKLVCFSSDQVYSGLQSEGPYTEETVRPANVYAAHKIEMEQRVLDFDPAAVMLRAQWMYDYYLKKPNYFMNMLNAEDTVRASSRQYRGLCYVKEVAENLEAVLSLPGGSYNFGSETTRSMFEITRDFLALLGKDVALEDVPPAHNLWMNCQKAATHGVRFSTVDEALLQCAKDHGVNGRGGRGGNLPPA
ncbi:MAG: sugar nucleotide-binding protein [Clostridia bacterium]|nr:sugar nucleotide-binding protein [Clostridia bacterium]